MKWTAPKVVEVSVGMEINMYACATRGSGLKIAPDRVMVAVP
jgi:coenzyme PQQ precursor peptide PqqA